MKLKDDLETGNVSSAVDSIDELADLSAPSRQNFSLSTLVKEIYGQGLSSAQFAEKYGLPIKVVTDTQINIERGLYTGKLKQKGLAKPTDLAI